MRSKVIFGIAGVRASAHMLLELARPSKGNRIAGSALLIQCQTPLKNGAEHAWPRGGFARNQAYSEKSLDEENRQRDVMDKYREGQPPSLM